MSTLTIDPTDTIDLRDPVAVAPSQPIRGLAVAPHSATRVLTVIRIVDIRRPAALVGERLGDLGRHEARSPRHGVSVAVTDDDPARSRYRRVTRRGLLRLRQSVEMTHTEDGSLRHEVIGGSLRGSVVTVRIDEIDRHRARVTTTMQAAVGRPGRLTAPILRRLLGRALERSLHDDRDDLESGPHAAEIAAHPAGRGRSAPL